MSLAAVSCAEGEPAAKNGDAAVERDAGDERTASGPALASDPACGVDVSPSWRVRLYDGTSPVATPPRSGGSTTPDMPVLIDVKASVVGSGEGVPSELKAGDDKGLASDVRYLQLKAGERRLTLVTHGIADFAAQLEAGSEVELSHHDKTAAYVAAARGPITTSLRAKGALLLHYAYASNTLELPKDFSVTLGEEYCSAHDRCRSWQGRALDITDPDGKQLSLRPGAVGRLTNHTAYAGASRQEGAWQTGRQEDEGYACSESGASAREILLVRD